MDVEGKAEIVGGCARSHVGEYLVRAQAIEKKDGVTCIQQQTMRCRAVQENNISIAVIF